jgi:hypothetical protein
MVGAMCTALDVIDDAMTQTRMQMAADVAALAGGANLSHYDLTKPGSLAQWQADVRAYYDANMPKGFMRLTMPDASFNATVTGTVAAGQTIKVSVSGSMPLLAPLIFGKGTSGDGSGSSPGGTPDTTTITASNSALRLPKSTLELVMVLDNTGSMADKATAKGDTKIAGLKTAAHALVDLILSQSGADSYIGMVPFTSTVNVKNVLPAGGGWLDPSFAYNATGVGMTKQGTVDGWAGCPVEPRDAGGFLYPKAYAPTDWPKFTPYFYNVPPTGLKIHSWVTSVDCKVAPVDTVASGVPVALKSGNTNRCGYVAQPNGIYADWEQVKWTVSRNKLVEKADSTTLRQNDGCMTTPVTFLTTDKSKLSTAIDQMNASGSTLIPLGILWGWRMLSSSWSVNVAGSSGWVSTDASLPRPEITQGLQRVMIVLTDGENSIGSSGDLQNNLFFNGLSGVGTKSLAAPTVFRPNGSSLTNATMDSVDDINSFQTSACTAIKNTGVTIYAITFGDVADNSVQAMQACASPGNYYHAPDNPTLTYIFQQIAGNLGVLRLTQSRCGRAPGRSRGLGTCVASFLARVHSLEKGE